MTEKTALLLHGTDGSDRDYFWFAATKKFLEGHGYHVWWPTLPNTGRPQLGESHDFIMANMPVITEETILIGHSSACPLILHLMESLPSKVKQVVLVGGFYQSLDNQEISDLMLPQAFDWEKIRSKAEEIIFINSDNDPWGCHDQQAREPAINLGASLIVATGQGHMGSVSYGQPYKEFPLLKRLLITS